MYPVGNVRGGRARNANNYRKQWEHLTTHASPCAHGTVVEVRTNDAELMICMLRTQCSLNVCDEKDEWDA